MGLVSWAKRTSHRLRRDAHMLWIAARDPRTPLAAKLVGGLIAAYALSPIDFIPDFVPILGLLDELILVPIGLAIAVMLVPKPLMAEFRDAADVAVQRPVSRLGAAIIIALWAIIGTFIALQIWALRYW